MRRLFILAARPDLSTQIDWLPELDRLKSLAKPLCEHKTLREQLMELIADRAALIAKIEKPQALESIDDIVAFLLALTGAAPQVVPPSLP